MKLPNLRIRYLICNLLLLTCTSLYADPSEYIIINYTDEDGLPQNSITGIGKDNLGFIWLMTQKGVVRYDGGNRFKLTDSLSSTLISDRILSLHQDQPTGGLWAQTSTGQLVHLHAGHAEAVKKDFTAVFPCVTLSDSIAYSAGLPNRYRWLLPEKLVFGDGTGNTYWVTKDSIFYLPKEAELPTMRQSYDHESPWQFCYVADRLYHVSSLQTLRAIDKWGIVHDVRLTGDILMENIDASIEPHWNTATGELFLYVNQNFYLLQPLPNGDLHSIRVLSDFDLKENNIHFAHYDIDNQLLLLGSESKGLFAIRKKKFRTVRANTGSSPEVYYFQTLLNDNRILTDHGNSFKLNGLYQSTGHLSTTRSHYSHHYDNSGNLWVLTGDTLYTYSTSSLALIEKKRNEEKGVFLYESNNGILWMGSHGGDILKYNATLDDFHSMASVGDHVSWIEQADANQLWFGTYQGLYLFDMLTNVVTPIPEFENKHIRCIYSETAERFWICTYQHGLFLYEKGQVTPFPLDENNYLATAHCILEDETGYFWISTNKGLFQVSKRQLLNFKNNPNIRPYYIHYSKQDGFATNEFNGGCQPCALQLPNGNFSFPSMDGLVWFNPLDIHPKLPNGHILIDEAHLDGSTVAIKDSLSLPNYFSRLELKVSTPYYGNQNNLYVEYSIGNAINSKPVWLSLNPTNHTISINKLSSGWHTVTVRLRNGLAPNSYTYGSLNLFVQPRFYETTWFIVLAIIGLVLVGWAIVRARTGFIVKQNIILSQKVATRTEKLRQQHELQKLLSASIAHDIKAPLNYVVMALQGIHQNMETEKSLLSSEINLVYMTTKQIYRYSNSLSQLAKVMLTKQGLNFHKIHLHTVVQEQISIFEPIASSNNTVFYNDIPVDMVVNSHIDVISIITHNLLDNATKFTKMGTIHLQAGSTITGISYLKVTDTGVGMRASEIEFYNNPDSLAKPIADAGQENGGLGLLLVKNIVNLIHGEITIRSAIGQGTIVTITLFPHHTA